MPRDVARQWLFLNWGTSPYGFLRSRDYDFRFTEWPGKHLYQIRSRWDDWEHNGCVKQGRVAIERAPEAYLQDFLLRNRTFPEPIILLDNRDEHLESEYPRDATCIPGGLVLIEGHMRFNIASYLVTTGSVNESLPVWMMERSKEPRGG